MVLIKICGITNLEDALFCAENGADMLGFNFYPKSARYIKPHEAAKITRQVQTFRIGVFVNAGIEEILRTVDLTQLEAIQLHGEETPEFVHELKRRTDLQIIKAFRILHDFDIQKIRDFPVDAILLDSYNPLHYGGTGEIFDWKIAKSVREIFPKIYLAGGLSAENVARAIEEVKPFAVDVCTGVEKAKGIKDQAKIKDFIKVVKYGSNKIST
jgi:phosphoribosylanthranilate isomerase